MSTLIKRLSGEKEPTTLVGKTVKALREAARDFGHGDGRFATSAMAQGFISMEGLSDTSPVKGELETSVDNLTRALEAFQEENKIKYTQVAKDAGIVAGLLAGDAQTFLQRPTDTAVALESHETVVTSPAAGAFNDGRMKVAMEAYDEKANKDATVYSIAYNMHAARQDEFGEAFFPTVVVTPDQVGYTVSIRVITVYDEVRRKISGAVNDFEKKNIIQAVIDPTILKNEGTRIIPVYRPESAEYFVDAATMAPEVYDLEGESIPTSPLQFGKQFSLLGISQTDALLETGILDSTDSIDPAVDLEAVYLKKGTEVIKITTLGLPGANFVYAPQGNYRLMRLAFDSVELGLKGELKTVDGVVSTEFAQIAALEVAVQIAVDITGKCNLEIGTTNVNSSELTVAAVWDKDHKKLALDAGNGKLIADLFADAELIGYTLKAFRSNMNRRQRGQLLDTTFYSQIYNVPLRSPITCPRPLTVGDQTDASDLAALITTTHIRTSNAAVAELHRVNGLLAEHVVGTRTINAAPPIFGVASWLVKPTYRYLALNVKDVLDSLKSSERPADIQAALVNVLRDMVYRLYTDSGYKAAADALAGGISQTPTVIIGTDPILARYLMLEGDIRVMGPDFSVKVVATLNETMKGKIYVSFGEFGAGKEGQPNPMHFGNMAWKPELTLVLPLHRNGANSKELTVQPSFLHIANLPVLGALDVTGIREVVEDKVNVNIHEVA